MLDAGVHDLKATNRKNFTKTPSEVLKGKNCGAEKNTGLLRSKCRKIKLKEIREAMAMKNKHVLFVNTKR